MTKNRKKIIASSILTIVIGGILLGAAIWYSKGSAKEIVLSLLMIGGMTVLCFIPKNRSRIFGLAMILLAAAGAFYLLESFTHNPFEMELSPQLLNILLILFLMMFLCGCSGKIGVGLQIGIVICLFAGLANYYTLEFRDSPILPWDLLSMRVALSVTNNYEFSVTYQEVWTAYGFLALLILSGKAGASIGRWKMRAVSAAVSSLLVFGIFRAMTITAVTDRLLTFSNLFTQWATYEDNGFFISFAMNTKYLKIDVPEGYSQKKAQELIRSGAEEYDRNHAGNTEQAGNTDQSGNTDQTGLSSETAPNVIVVMNEAFSDLAVLGEVKTNEDYMPFFHSLMEDDQVQTGQMYVSVCGGNTANTEYEFLTGESMAFLPAGSVPYQQYINRSRESLVRRYLDNGYAAFASHPYSASGWDRDEVYPFMGFEEAYFRPSFSHPKIIRKYVCDEAQYQLIEKKVEEQTDKPVFSFNVTMQNHGGYSEIYDSFPLKVKLENIASKPGTENYLTLIQESDRQLEALIGYYRNVETPTIIVFFGDHQPSDFVANCIWNQDGKNKSERTLEEQQKRYLVPYVVWSNYDSDVDVPDVLSANYLGAWVEKYSGTELEDYEKYLLNLQSHIPVITANGYWDENMQYHSFDQIREEDKVWIEDYRKVCYYRLFGEK